MHKVCGTPECTIHNTLSLSYRKILSDVCIPDAIWNATSLSLSSLSEVDEIDVAQRLPEYHDFLRNAKSRGGRRSNGPYPIYRSCQGRRRRPGGGGLRRNHRTVTRACP